MTNSSLNERLESVLALDPAETTAKLRGEFDRQAGGAKHAIILFGAGTAGRHALAGMRTAGCEPLAFADNNSNLWGTKVDGLQVVSPAEAAQSCGHSAVFVVTIFQDSAARRQLMQMGVKRVATLPPLYWKFAETLLPMGSLAVPGPRRPDAIEIRAAYDLWSDEASRREFVAQLEWRTTLDSDRLSAPLPLEEMYFPRDLIAPREDEVFVDCGGFDGDTLRTFLDFSAGRFRSYLALEPDPLNHARFEINLAGLDPDQNARVVLRQSAVGVTIGKVCFDARGTLGSHVAAGGKAEVDCVTLDSICYDIAPTFIKFDVEGAEADALQGCESIIARHAPMLAICVYHKPEDLWSLPLMVRRMNPDYRFFLRRYVEDCWEMVCYAIPADRLLGVRTR
jgi:FkbM family methyltransferase